MLIKVCCFSISPYDPEKFRCSSKFAVFLSPHMTLKNLGGEYIYSWIEYINIAIGYKNFNPFQLPDSC